MPRWGAHPYGSPSPLLIRANTSEGLRWRVVRVWRAALAPIQPAFADPERLALAGFLPGSRGVTRRLAACPGLPTRAGAARTSGGSRDVARMVLGHPRYAWWVRSRQKAVVTVLPVPALAAGVVAGGCTPGGDFSLAACVR